MKKQIFTLLMVFVLAMATALVAQTTSQLPPSQQVDETNKPETGPGPDVDVDLGRNADNGVADVDVDRKTDPDTKAQGDPSHLNNTNSGTVGTTSGAYGDTETGMAGDNDNLPATASETPLLGLIGLLALGLAFTLRAIR